MGLDLTKRGRAVFCVIFFGSEVVLVATAGLRTDRAYGFRMFPEASAITLHVSRRLQDGTVVPLTGGSWTPHGCEGAPHTFVWGKMVRFPAPWKLDAPVGAPYGVDNEVQRARDGLAWVAAHTPEDCETRAFVAHVEAVRNGRPEAPVDFEVPR
jgi:hypothetical protein